MKLKAKCKRLAERSELVGNTVFTFGKNGICEIEDNGFVYQDFVLLCKKNGVQDITVNTSPEEASSTQLTEAEVKAGLEYLAGLPETCLEDDLDGDEDLDEDEDEDLDEDLNLDE